MAVSSSAKVSKWTLLRLLLLLAILCINLPQPVDSQSRSYLDQQQQQQQPQQRQRQQQQSINSYYQQQNRNYQMQKRNRQQGGGGGGNSRGGGYDSGEYGGRNGYRNRNSGPRGGGGIPPPGDEDELPTNTMCNLFIGVDESFWFREQGNITRVRNSNAVAQGYLS